MKYLMTFALSAVLIFTGCSKGDAKTGDNTPQGTQTAQTTANDDAATALGLLPVDKAPMAPDWELEKADGGTMKLSDYRGKVVVLDFWDTWCPPCKAEIPGFIELQNEYADKGLVIIGGAFANEGPDAVRKFVADWKMNYPVVFITPEVNAAYGGIRSIPTTFVIDTEGRARGMHVGYAEKSVFEAEIKALLPN